MVTDSYSYDAYGNLLGRTGTNENDYLYRGEQFDDDLDLQYLRARYYDPTTGRFISTDPFEGVLEQPVSRHRYLYGNANPVMNLDPSGLISLQETMATLAVAGILSVFQNGVAITNAMVTGSTENTKWTGLLVSPNKTYSLPLPFKPSLGTSIFAVNSSPFEAKNGQTYQYKNTPVLVIRSSLFAGYSKEVTGDDIFGLVGGFELETPAETTKNWEIWSLMRGYLSFGATARIPVFGYGKQFILMGFARGNAHGWHFGTSVEGGITLDSGLSIPLYPLVGARNKPKVPRTPKD